MRQAHFPSPEGRRRPSASTSFSCNCILLRQGKLWRMYSCVLRSQSCERFRYSRSGVGTIANTARKSAQCHLVFKREHFEALTFDCHKQHAAPISKASVHTSVNAACMSACATKMSRLRDPGWILELV